jgi:hypothetical protein
MGQHHFRARGLVLWADKMRTFSAAITKCVHSPLGFIGAPYRIRTCDPQLRRLLLYPTELRARTGLLGFSKVPRYQQGPLAGPGSSHGASRAFPFEWERSKLWFASNSANLIRFAIPEGRQQGFATKRSLPSSRPPARFTSITH